MKKIAIAGMAAGALLLAACSSTTPEADPAQEARDHACEQIQELEPGTLERSADIRVLADSASTSGERTQAMKRVATDDYPTAPYECSGVAFESFVDGMGD